MNDDKTPYPRLPQGAAIMRWLQVVADHLITGAASAGVACLFVLAVVLFYQVAETGSAADWVASVANAVILKGMQVSEKAEKGVNVTLTHHPEVCKFMSAVKKPIYESVLLHHLSP